MYRSRRLRTNRLFSSGGGVGKSTSKVVGGRDKERKETVVRGWWRWCDVETMLKGEQL